MESSTKQTNKDLPDVSIIIPVYNVEKYLRQCLDSIIKQSLENIEIICIDDCSTDSSYQILKEYKSKDNRIKILKNSENSGVSVTRNKGLDIAKGKYICFVDSDDWITEENLEITFNIAEDNNLDLLLYKLEVFNEETQQFKKTDNYSISILKNFENTIFNYNDINPEIIYHISPTPHSKLYLREIIEENKIRFMEGVMFEDNLFFNEFLFKSERVSLIDKYLYTRRIHPKSVMHSNGLITSSMINISEGLLNVLLKDSELYEKFHKNLYNFIFTSIGDRFRQVNIEYVNEYYDFFKKFIFKLIVEYNLNTDIKESLWYNNLQDYYLALKSINDPQKEIIETQKITRLDPKISIFINSSNYSTEQIKDIFDSILNQNIGFQFLEIFFLHNNQDLNKNIKEYEETFYNIHSFKLNENYQKHDYIKLLNNISTDYVIFINNTINKSFLLNLVEKIRLLNVVSCLPSEETCIDPVSNRLFDKNIECQNNKSYIPLNSIENKLFKTKALCNEENFSEDEKGNIILNSKFLFKNNFSEENIIEYLTYQLDNFSIKDYNFTIEILKNNFFNIKPADKIKSYENIKNFFYNLIQYKEYEKIISNLSKSNKEFFELALMSIEDDDPNLRTIQNSIKLDIPICIIVYIKDNPTYELNNIIHSLLKQSIGLAHLEILLLNNNSKDLNTINKLNELTKTFYNIKSIDLDKELSIDEAYNYSIKYTDKQYLLFVNNEHVLLNSSIKDLFQNIRKGNMNLANGSIQEETDIHEDNIFTKIIKQEFLEDNDIEFKCVNDTIIFDPKIHNLKGIIEINIPVLKR